MFQFYSSAAVEQSSVDEEYAKGVEICKNNLHGRLIMKKGEKAPTTKELQSILSMLCKSISIWRMISLGKGYFEFQFSSL
ncbi:DUF4283 domain protein, partial [Trifolium medium]|nr:DUF4283 domain protein [Trifolium medium]